MRFRTETEPLAGYGGMIVHGAPVWTIGSCFADNIGQRLAADLFEVRVNPFGPLFNPASIASMLLRVVRREEVAPESFFEHEGLWRSFDFHSRVSGLSARAAADHANRLVNAMRDELPRLRCLTVTLGSSFTFTNTATGRVVANCHKQPVSLFSLGSLRAGEISAMLAEAFGEMRNVNPGLKVVLTVSPVRHSAYGQRRDKLSKAACLLASAELEEAGAAVYFPAYEIMMDDLRDYRFYAPDMAHPTDQAADYIYDIFAHSFFSEETRKMAVDARAYTRLAAHRPADPVRHRLALDAARQKLLAKYPQLNNALAPNGFYSI